MANVKAVFWDFGGVVTSSPFEAFAAYECEAGLPVGLVGRINQINPDENAWAKFERSDIDRAEFCAAFEAEAQALGYEISGARVLGCLVGAPRPQMVRALERIRPHFAMACLTNNVAKMRRPPEQEAEIARIMGLFHHVIESSKVGSRKPEERFYRIALEAVGVEPEETVFLDDLGVNLKAARAMGMITIKVSDPDEALGTLGPLLGMDLLTDS